MALHSGCADFTLPGTRGREEGNTLAILLGVIVILGLIGGALFQVANGGRQRALQSQYRDRAVGSVEINLQTMRLSATRQFQEQAWLDVASLNINQTQIQGSPETGLYNLDLQAQAEGPQIFATQTHGTAFEPLIAPDDPFRGLAAVVDTVNVAFDEPTAVGCAAQFGSDLPRSHNCFHFAT